VPVDVEQARPPTPPQREHRAENDRAVSSEHDGKLPTLEHALDHVGQARRPCGNRMCVQRTRLWITLRVVARCLDALEPMRSDPPREPAAEETFRQPSRKLTPAS
jgi:hypothetical protein